MSDRWLHSFETFFSDMGKCPTNKSSLGRVDNSKGYEPGNCQWQDDLEQANNKSTSRFITFGGKTLTIAQWAIELGVQASWIYTRIYRGWTPEEALIHFSVDKENITPIVNPV